MSDSSRRRSPSLTRRCGSPQISRVGETIFLTYFKAAFGRGRLRAARFARRARRPTPRRPRARISAQTRGPATTPRYVNCGHRGRRGRGARHRQRYAGLMTSPAVSNDSYGRGSILACRDVSAAAGTVNRRSDQAARQPLEAAQRDGTVTETTGASRWTRWLDILAPSRHVLVRFRACQDTQARTSSEPCTRAGFRPPATLRA
jgi:hypothetical protein